MESNSQQRKPKVKLCTNQGIGVGIGVGIALGVALGAAFENVGLGLALGVAFGAALGPVFIGNVKSTEDRNGDNN